MKKTIPVVGMACAACSANVEKKLNSLHGVVATTVNLSSRLATIDFDPAVISLVQMKEAVSRIGYDLVIESGRSVEDIKRQEYVVLRRKTLCSWIIAIAVMSVSMGWISVGDSLMSNIVSMSLALLSIAYCGVNFYRSAWRQLMHGGANMDSLVALSTAIAFLFSVFNTFWGDMVWTARNIEWHTYFDAAVMIIAFVLVGRMMEEKAKDGTSTSIRQLMGMAPKTARVVDGDRISEVPISTIDKGDIIEVRAGEKIPVDGDVIYAESFMTADVAYVDESMVTGEPTPTKKVTDSRVLAGTIPCQGKLRLRARQIGEETALAQIIKMVQQAQGSKAPMQRIVDRAAQVFVPTIAGVALLTFLVWWMAGGSAALPQAILSAIAVLVIACPCAMGLATPTALMVGIGEAAQKQVLIKDAAALEGLRKINALVTDKTGTLTIPNKNVDFTQADSLPLEQREKLKPHVKEAIREIRKSGIEVYLMSGDKREAVAYWAEQAGITHYQSEVRPQDKEALVRELQSQGKRVAMMGDGVNDTQALALADVSIAIGKGTDVAMDVAQITLMGDDMMSLPIAVKLSRRTVKMIWQNLFWAFIYNIICIPLAGGTLLLFGIDFQITPMWASALMAFSSVSVVLNSLRLKLSPSAYEGSRE